MLAGLLLGYVHDRRLMCEAQVYLAIRWFIGYEFHEQLPDHSSLTRICQRWGKRRFREMFRRTVHTCLDAKVTKTEVVYVDTSLIRPNVSWESLAERNGVHQIICKLDWEVHDRAAPFRRNDELLSLLPKGVIAFPGSGITDNLVDKARTLGIPVQRVAA